MQLTRLAIAGMLSAVILSSVAEAGPVGRPLNSQGSLFQGQRHTISKAFRGGEVATVTVAGDGNADLDLYIYDSSGRMIASDRSPNTDASVSWVPSSTQMCRIVIRNYSGGPSTFVITSN